MKVTFVLPGSSGKPVGGPKVVFEYANGLVRRGHEVSVVQSPIARIDSAVSARLKAVVRYPQRLLDKSYIPYPWFNLDHRVDLKWVPTLGERYIPNADVVVATAWKTAEWVANYSTRKGSKYYLIQHQEIWDGPYDRVMATWKMPLKKIVIARWLKDIATELGETATYIPNGLDFKSFGIDAPVAERQPASVMMLYHKAQWKGSNQGLIAIQKAKEEARELTATLFGIPKRPVTLPSWIAYCENPPQGVLRKLYNRSAIFVSPSLAEGWPLPPAEAMMCGAAFTGTDIGGHREYTRHLETGLLSPKGDPAAMSENIILYLRDQELRVKIASAGNKYVQQFSWDRAVKAFEDEIGS